MPREIKTEKPILFNTEMVKAILEGRKTQTRRIVKPQPQYGVTGCPYTKGGWSQTHNGGACECGKSLNVPCHIGDTLWVRETFADLRGMGFDQPFAYLANCLNKNGVEDADGKRCRLDYGVKWKPSIHMPRAAARLFLKVTDVRVERLQDITEDGAKAEGTYPIYDAMGNVYSQDGYSIGYRLAFEELWNNIYKNWNDNPWVWVIEFERMV
jgi:hypothetical protein